MSHKIFFRKKPRSFYTNHWNSLIPIFDRYLEPHVNIRQFLRQDKNFPKNPTVLYVGMATDILTPLFSFDAKVIYAVDLIDTDGNWGLPVIVQKKQNPEFYNTIIQLNYIIPILKALENLDIDPVKMTRSKNTYEINFVWNNVDRKIIYYLNQNYLNFIPPAAKKNGIDLYCCLGAPCFLTDEDADEVTDEVYNVVITKKQIAEHRTLIMALLQKKPHNPIIVTTWKLKLPDIVETKTFKNFSNFSLLTTVNLETVNPKMLRKKLIEEKADSRMVIIKLKHK